MPPAVSPPVNVQSVPSCCALIFPAPSAKIILLANVTARPDTLAPNIVSYFVKLPVLTDFRFGFGIWVFDELVVL